MTEREALLRAEASLRDYAKRNRQSVQAGAFTLYVTTNNANPYLSVAVPAEHETEDWDGSIDSLMRAAADHGLRPRLEFMSELHPSLAPSLVTRGFQNTGTAPVMIRTSSATGSAHLRPSRPATGAPRARPESRYRQLDQVDEDVLLAYLDGQSRAFDMPRENGRSWLPVILHGLQERSILGGLLEVEGTVVAGATLQRAEPAAELTGVWTDAGCRRRGWASMVCEQLLQDAQAAGIRETWLSAAEGALGLYHGLGFRSIGTQQNYEF